MEIENVSGITEDGVDLFFPPNIKGAFSVLGFAVLEKAIGIFGGKKSAVLRRHIAGDVFENVARD